MNNTFQILVVDDDPMILDLVSTFFLTMPNEVTCVTASDVKTALFKISNQEFDLILIDFKMPGRTGIEMAQNLKKSPKFNRIPIVLMSGALMQHDAIVAIETGIRDILIKPFSMKQLFQKISTYKDKGVE